MKAKRILTISDRGDNPNGKDGGGFIDFDLHYPSSACRVSSGVLYADDSLVDLNKVRVVIFNFNEDVPWKKPEEVKTMTEIAKLIKSTYPHIVIYNDPEKCVAFGDKAESYDKIKHINHKNIKVPKYKNIESIEDIKTVDFFPNIIKCKNTSHTRDDSISASIGQLIKNYESKFSASTRRSGRRTYKNEVFCVEYLDPYVKHLKSHCCARLMIFNNKLIDYFFRPSDGWNIHTSDQRVDKIQEADTYFKNYLQKNPIDTYLDELHSIFGNGFFCHDVILHNNKLYVCELGLKVFDNTYYQFIRKNLPSFNDKLMLQKENLKKYYREMI